MKNNDCLFREQEVFSPQLLARGLRLYRENEQIYLEKGANDTLSIVLPMKHGCVYVIRFGRTPRLLHTAVCGKDPLLLPAGEALACIGQAHSGAIEDFMYVPQESGLYLVVQLGEGEDFPVSIGQTPVILGHDTDDCWYLPPETGDLNGNGDSWGDWKWTCKELCENVYDKLTAKDPGYISRISIGTDESGKYDMPAYIFEPEGYEQTLFLTGGLHTDEHDAYLSLARVLQLVCESDGTHPGLEYLRRKVKLIVIPLVNVWSSEETRVRRNSTGTDLNRDFEELTQQESRNVAALLTQYRGEVGAVLDFHGASPSAPGLYYQFNIQAPNAAVTCKVINHIHERLKEKGYAQDPADLTRIPGKYIKSTKFLQGYTYNVHGISNLVAEHNLRRWYPHHSKEGFYHGVECFGNILIQTALARLKLLKREM